MKNEYKIAIIGCGVSGLTALIQLLDDKIISEKLSKIIIFDENPILDSNIYLDATDDLYLNTSASLNSLLPDKPDDFYNWVIENQDKWRPLFPSISEVQPETFLPRNIFLLYMKDLFSIYLARAKQQEISIEIIRSYVEDLVTDGLNSIIVKTKNGISYTVRQAIASIGDGSCKNKYTHLRGISNYLDRPCVPVSYYENLLAAQSILVIGTMLSAVDTLLLLNKNKAKITLASSTGTFPSVRSVYRDNPENYRELQHISDINSLLQAILEKLPQGCPQERDATDLSFYKNQDDSWCDYIAPFLNRANDLWPASSEEEKIRFKERFQLTRAKRYMSAIPPIVADKLAPKFSKGDIVIKKGLANVTYHNNEKKFVATYTNGDQGKFDACINASAATTNARTTLDLKNLSYLKNLYILGDSNKNNFMNNGIFLFVREVERIIPLLKRQMSLVNSIVTPAHTFDYQQQVA